MKTIYRPSSNDFKITISHVYEMFFRLYAHDVICVWRPQLEVRGRILIGSSCVLRIQKRTLSIVSSSFHLFKRWRIEIRSERNTCMRNYIVILRKELQVVAEKILLFFFTFKRYMQCLLFINKTNINCRLQGLSLTFLSDWPVGPVSLSLSQSISSFTSPYFKKKGCFSILNQPAGPLGVNFDWSSGVIM